MLDIGRTKNISVEEMLLDYKSPNYIIKKVIDFAKAEKYTEESAVYPNLTGIFKFKDADPKYILGTIQHPKKPEESLEEYVERVGFN